MRSNPHGGDIYGREIVLDYSVNVNPYGPPESVRQAVVDSVLELDRYPDFSAKALRKALAEKHGIAEEILLFGNGAAELILAICHALCPKKALVTAPSFAEYETSLRAVGAELSYLYLKEEEDFILTEEILTCLDENLDLLFLCSPNNPTGRMVDPVLMDLILSKTRELGIVLVVDECFLEFLWGEEKLTLKHRLKEFPNLIVLRAFTKTYAIPALRLGYAMCENRELVRRIELSLPAWNLSGPAQKAGLAALSETDYVNKARDLILTERERLTDFLSSLGCKVWPSVTNYLFFRGPEDLSEKLLKEQILIRDCSNYPGLCKGYYRIAVKLPQENDQLMERIRKVW